MPQRVLNFIDDHLPVAWKLSFVTFLSTLTWMDLLDWGAKIVTGIITIILFVYARIRHNQEMKNKKIQQHNLELEREKLDQEIFLLMQKNKNA